MLCYRLNDIPFVKVNVQMQVPSLSEGDICHAGKQDVAP